MANGNQTSAQAGQLGEILKGLLELAGRGAAKATGGGNQTFPAEGIKALSTLLGTLSNAPAQENLKQATSGTPTEGTLNMLGALTAGQTFDESQLDPLQKVTLKTAEKIRAKQVEEAAQQIPLEEILKKANINLSQQTQQFNQMAGLGPLQPQGGQPGMSQPPVAMSSAPAEQGMSGAPTTSQDQTQMDQGGQQGILKTLALLIPGVAPARAMAAALESKGLENQAKRQKIAGKEPLQEGEKEALEIEAQNSFFNNIASASNKTPSIQENALVNNLNSGISQIDALNAQLDKDPNIFKKLTAPGDPTRAAIVTMQEDVVDILGRLRSQGAITEDEVKAFKRQLPKIGLGAALENSKTAKFKLNKLRKLFNDIKETAQPRTSDFSSKINQLLQSGATREQIYRIYKEGGL